MATMKDIFDKINEGCSNGFKVDENQWRKDIRELYKETYNINGWTLKCSLLFHGINDGGYGVFLKVVRWRYANKYGTHETQQIKFARVNYPKAITKRNMKILQHYTELTTDEMIMSIYEDWKKENNIE